MPAGDGNVATIISIARASRPDPRIAGDLRLGEQGATTLAPKKVTKTDTDDVGKPILGPEDGAGPIAVSPTRR